MNNTKSAIKEHYTNDELLEKIHLSLKKNNIDINNLKIDDLQAVDEMHSRGTDATNELIEVLEAKPNTNILDIGAGMGGPARRLAHKTGCYVTCVDLTESLNNIANYLTNALKLNNLVKHIQADATNLSIFADNYFDGAWTIHAGMNIEDKKNYYGEIYRVLKPNAKFIIYDIFATNKNGEIKYPLPWASTSNTSFLITKDVIKNHLNSTGFKIIDIFERTSETVDSFEKMLKNTSPIKQNTLLTPEVRMGENAKDKISNLYDNLSTGKLAVYGIVCSR